MKPLLIFTFVSILCACSSVTVEIPTGYKLSATSNKRLSNYNSQKSLLVSQPTAAAGYESTSMRYVKRAYQLDSFVKNEWVAKPKEMLSPLLVQSLQNTGYFKAVVPSSFVGDTDFRLDTELLILQQDFISRPSREVISIKAALYDGRTEKVIATQVFNAKEIAPVEGPYGGVIAANKGLKLILDKMMPFVIKAAKKA